MSGRKEGKKEGIKERNKKNSKRNVKWEYSNRNNNEDYKINKRRIIRNKKQ